MLYLCGGFTVIWGGGRVLPTICFSTQLLQSYLDGEVFFQGPVKAQKREVYRDIFSLEGFLDITVPIETGCYCGDFNDFLNGNFHGQVSRAGFFLQVFGLNILLCKHSYKRVEISQV